VCLCVCVCVCACVLVCLCVCACVHVYVRAFMREVRAFVCACVLVCVSVRVCVCGVFVNVRHAHLQSQRTKFLCVCIFLLMCVRECVFLCVCMIASAYACLYFIQVTPYYLACTLVSRTLDMRRELDSLPISLTFDFEELSLNKPLQSLTCRMNGTPMK